MAECPETGYGPCEIMAELDCMRTRVMEAEAEVDRLTEALRLAEEDAGQLATAVQGLRLASRERTTVDPEGHGCDCDFCAAYRGAGWALALHAARLKPKDGRWALALHAARCGLDKGGPARPGDAQ